MTAASVDIHPVEDKTTERITIIQQQIQNFKKALQDENTWTHQLYESNTPKKDFIRKWGEALEELHNLGIYTEDITTISTHISKELKEMGLAKAIVHARRALPFKYKNPAMIHAESLFSEVYMTRDLHDRKKVKSKEDIQRENKDIINDYQEDVALFQHFIKKLESTEFACKLDPHTDAEFRTRKRGMRKLLRDAIDGRDKVLPEKLHLLMQGYSETTKADAFSKYLKYIREIVDLTPKQTVKILSGRTSKVELLYDPTNRAEARQCGFYGFPCDECGSWRVDKRYNTDMTKDMLFCYACKEWTPVKVEPLMKK